MKKLLLAIVFAVAATNVFGANTYTWKGGTSGEYSLSSKWVPDRLAPANDDILVFDLGNIDNAGTAGSITVNNITANETIGQLQIVRATGTSTGVKSVTFSGTTTTLNITGDLVIGFYASGTNCQLNDGGNIIKIGGNFTTVNNQSATSTYHSGLGKLLFTSATATMASGGNGGNMNFQNIEIGDGTNAANVTLGTALQINGEIKINSNATLSNNGKSFILNSTNGLGGTISGNGSIIATSSSGTFYVQGTAGAQPQTVGTINFSTTSAANSTINSLQINRPNSILTIGTAYSNTLIIAGTLTLNDGTLNDGGNIIKINGSPTIAVGAGTTGIVTGSSKIQVNRANATQLLVTAGKTATVGNIEIINGNSNVFFSLSTGANLIINGTLTLNKANSGIILSGSTLTFQNADIPIVKTAGSIVLDATSNLIFGTSSNKGGAAATIPNDLFTNSSSVATTPNFGSFTINRTNSLTLGNQAITIINDLNLTSGTLADNGNTISVGGNITGTGTHSGTGKISMTGSSKTISAVTALGNFDINTTGTISATAALPINGNLSFTAAGTLADDGNTITVGGNITGTTGTHLSTGSGKISMTGAGKSFTANTYGNFEIAGGTSGSPISAIGSSNFTSGSTFTVTSGSYFNAGLNTMQFGSTAPSGTVNISGTASTTRGNGFYGTYNSAFGCSATSGYSLTGLAVNFLSGSTAIYNSTGSGQTISPLIYNDIIVTGARTAGTNSIGFYNGNVTINGNLTIDTDVTGSTITFANAGTNSNVTFAGSGTQNIDFTNSANNSGTSAITFYNLTINSGSDVVSNVNIPVSGSLSGTGSFSNASTKITMTGSTKNISGLSISNLDVSSAGTITTTAAPAISGTLSLTSGTFNNTTNGLTLGNGATIARTNGTLTAAPTYGTSANVTYNGSSAVTSGNELPTSSSVLSTLTVNNTAGVSIGANATAENLTINASGILNVSAGKQLTVSTSMTNNGTLNLLSTSGGGTATILTPASISGTNAANVEQYLASSRNWYMSSPVTGATASAGPTYYKYVEALNNGTTWTPVNSGDTYALMTGYIVKPTTATTYNFSGTLNTGNKTISGLTSTATAKTGFNLVGNPYPSYVKWSEVEKTNVGETMWYRTHDGSAYKFYTYHPVDGAGGIGVPSTVTNYIPPMQAFWVKVNASQTGSLQFLNSSRDHQDGAGSVFRAPKATSSELKLLRLQVSNTTNSDETVLYFNTNASDNLDAYDSQKMFNNNASIPEIYTQAGTEKLVINGLSEVKYDTEIPLGFVTGQTNSFSIKATELRNFESGTRVILRDKVDVVDYELNGDNAYTFTSDAVNSTNRFSVLFKSPSVSTEIADAKSSNIYAFVNANNNIVISAPEKSAYSIYNAVGQLIENGILNMKHETRNNKIAAGVYLVKVNNQSTRVVVK